MNSEPSTQSATDANMPAQYPQPLQLYTLLAALALGVLLEQLLWEQGFTPWIFWIAVATFQVAAGTLIWLNQQQHRPAFLLWAAVAFVCAGLRVLHDSVELNGLLALCCFAAMMFFLLSSAGIAPVQVLPSHCLQLLPQGFVAFFTRPFVLLLNAGATNKPDGSSLHTLGRGLLVAAPVLFIFGSLFVSADAGLARWWDTLNPFTSNLPIHVLFIAMLSWVCACFLSFSWQPLAVKAQSFSFTYSAKEHAIVLASVLALFAVFALSQLGYLLGSSQALTNRSGLSLAEFARHGFFQMLVIVGFALIFLALQTANTQKPQWFKPVALALLLCASTALLAACQKLWLYMQFYGLTMDRLIASTIILWLAFCVISFALTFLQQKPQGFVLRTACFGIGLLVVLALLNPAALITRTNIALAASQQKTVDVNYLQQLGYDAVPTLLAQYEQLSPKAQCDLAVAWLVFESPQSESLNRYLDWRSWSLSHERALAAIADKSPQLLVALQRTGLPTFDNLQQLLAQRPSLVNGALPPCAD